LPQRSNNREQERRERSFEAALDGRGNHEASELSVNPEEHPKVTNSLGINGARARSQIRGGAMIYVGFRLVWALVRAGAIRERLATRAGAPLPFFSLRQT